MSKKRTLAVGTILVAGAGYIAGLLTAPKSGRETRKDIRDAAQKAKNEAEHRLKQAHNELNLLLEETAAIAKKSSSKIAAEIDKVRAKAETVRQKSRELLSAVHEGEAEDKDLQNAIDDVKKASSHLKKYIEKHNPAKTAK